MGEGRTKTSGCLWMAKRPVRSRPFRFTGTEEYLRSRCTVGMGSSDEGRDATVAFESAGKAIWCALEQFVMHFRGDKNLLFSVGIRSFHSSVHFLKSLSTLRIFYFSVHARTGAVDLLGFWEEAHLQL